MEAMSLYGDPDKPKLSSVVAVKDTKKPERVDGKSVASPSVPTEKASVFAGDLLTSKYANAEFSPGPTSGTSSKLGLLAPRPAPPLEPIIRAPEPSLRFNAPFRSTDPFTSRNPPPSFEFRPSPPRHPHRLSEKPEYLNAILSNAASRMDANTSFGHTLSKHATIDSKVAQSRLGRQASQRLPFTLMPTQPRVPLSTPPTKQVKHPGGDMMSDLLPPPGAHDGKFDMMSSHETSEAAMHQKKVDAKMSEMDAAFSAWARPRTKEPSAPASRPCSDNSPKNFVKAFETPAKKSDEAVEATQTGKKENSKPQVTPDQNEAAKTPQSAFRFDPLKTVFTPLKMDFTPPKMDSPPPKKDEHMEHPPEGPDQQKSYQQMPNKHALTPSPIDPNKKRRVDHGNELGKMFAQQWNEYKQKKKDALTTEHQRQVTALEATKVERVRQLNQEQSKRLSDHREALLKKLASFEKEQKEAYDEQLSVLATEQSEAHEKLILAYQDKLNLLSTSLNDEHKAMEERLNAGIRAYTDQLGSKDGMTKMAKRLFPGAEHGDPSDDIKVVKLPQTPSASPVPQPQTTRSVTSANTPTPKTADQHEPDASGIAEPQKDKKVGTGKQETSGDMVEPGNHESEPTEKRRVKLMNLPKGCSAKTVAYLVWGGDLESIDYSAETKSATVLFMRHEDCAKYLKTAGPRIKYQPSKDRPAYWVHVEGSHVADPISAEVQEFAKDDMTRCIQIEDLDSEWTVQALTDTCAKSSRPIEHIYESVDTDGVSVDRHAIRFK
ncbi:MAG: hypothetical protein M1822_007805 [Bathelium mastoideum]|nr:MAG: hypothetical protein M1822_007805 [Bathelium mastoideum]